MAPATDIAVRGSSHGGYAASTKNTAIAAIASNTGRSAINTAIAINTGLLGTA